MFYDKETTIRVSFEMSFSTFVLSITLFEFLRVEYFVIKYENKRCNFTLTYFYKINIV